MMTVMSHHISQSKADASHDTSSQITVTRPREVTNIKNTVELRTFFFFEIV